MAYSRSYDLIKGMPSACYRKTGHLCRRPVWYFMQKYRHLTMNVSGLVFYAEISTFDHECVIIIMKNKLMKEEILVKTTAFIVADWFIAHNNAVVRYNSADNISNLKIQKLLYYAQGCSLASLKEPLFDEEIMAWKHFNNNPVQRSVGDCAIRAVSVALYPAFPWHFHTERSRRIL